MYTHDITGRIFYNIYYITFIYIYICTHFNFLIYGISIEIVIFCNYTNTNLENYSCNSIYIYICYLYNTIQISRIYIIVFVIPTFIYTYIERNKYSEKTAFEYI